MRTSVARRARRTVEVKMDVKNIMTPVIITHLREGFEIAIAVVSSVCCVL